jgi:hypothetical protein
MKDISRDGYTTEEIMNALKGIDGSRQINFRFDLLDENDNKINELYDVIDAEVEMSAFSTIKRTASFSLREESETVVEYTSKRLIDFENTTLGGM